MATEKLLLTNYPKINIMEAGYFVDISVYCTNIAAVKVCCHYFALSKRLKLKENLSLKLNSFMS